MSDAVPHVLFMTAQMIDSQLASTREYWRRKIGLPESVVTDPRPLAEIAKWRQTIS